MENPAPTAAKINLWEKETTESLETNYSDIFRRQRVFLKSVSLHIL
jgi:hypothetical protein